MKLTVQVEAADLNALFKSGSNHGLEQVRHEQCLYATCLLLMPVLLRSGSVKMLQLDSACNIS